MSIIGRPCGICAAPSTPGTGRCAAHPPGVGRHPRSCATCGVRTAANRCPACQADHDTAIRARQTWRGAYALKEYRSARAFAMLRARGRCEDCGRSAGVVCVRHRRLVKLQADHVVAIVDGGSNGPENLRIRCACCCHAAKTSSDRRGRGDRVRSVRP